ncbi:MAG: aldo/keto reductase [Draconibacterium sp.]|nr:aldo/keto reductase [Draconibacterium sp.]
MKNINRRRFIQKSAVGVAGAIVAPTAFSNSHYIPSTGMMVDEVQLGKRGMQVPRLAMGTGSYGWKKTSAQKKLGEKEFVKVAMHAYDRGIRFMETADMYGTHQFVGKAMQNMDREKVTLLTKIMVYPHQDWYTPEPFQKSIDRFRKELKTDYFDIMLLHCMVNDEWPDEYKRYMDAYSEAQQKGIIKKVGLSCHDLGALKVAAEHPWPDLILARINHGGAKMDGKPVDVMPVLKKAKENGKGVIGMKVFGCGDLTDEEQRQKSLNYVMGSGNVDCMTIGVESTEEIDDNIARVMKLANS